MEREYELWAKRHKVLNRMLRWLFAADIHEDVNGFTPLEIAKLRVYYTSVILVLSFFIIGLVLIEV